MQNIPTRLNEIAEQVKNGETPQKETVRTLLAWFGAQRRGFYIVYDIRDALKKLGLQTSPDFEFAYIDSLVEFIPAHDANSNEGISQVSTTPITASNATESIVSPPLIAVTTDPTYRIGKLASANTPPLSVKPDNSLSEAITLMLSRDFSQLPVMETERDVKGVISWASIGSRLALGQSCQIVRDCMEPHHEISNDTSLFSAIDSIVAHEYLLVRDSTKKICGIVTTSDLSLQFRQLGEPFLLLGEIENHIRRLIQGKFTIDELAAARDPAENTREIKSVSDLSFGEYIRLLENPARWSNLKVVIDRGVFIGRLDKVRLIRNDVMHFDPDGIPDSDLRVLRDFVRFLQSLSELGVI